MGQEPRELKQQSAQTREQSAAMSSAAMTFKRLRHAPMIDSLLGAQYAPLLPLTWRVHLHRWRPRRYRPDHILVPAGYTAELVAKNFNEPVHCCFDDQGSCYVIECGHKIEARPRVLKVNLATGEWEVFFDLPDDRWKITGAVTGACWYDGHLYLMNTDTLSRITPDKRLEDLVTDLPGKGDHQSNYPVIGPDGKIYFGQGTHTNTGVVGADNYAYEWLRHFPQAHDVPGADIVLTGQNYKMPNVLGTPGTTVKTGAFVPFGTETTSGQIIKGSVRCNGSVLRCNPDGSGLELVAWGLRNPYGIAFTPDGRLFATEHGIDERNNRHIIGDPEDFYEITEGAWYGWPDFASGIALDDPHWGEPGRGRGREPVIAEHPDPNPPKPFAQFAQHSGPNGVDFSRDSSFGFEGDAFVALFGDLTPVTARLTTPSGFKVVRVDMRTREVVDFAVNKFQGPASRLPHAGFERPSHCQFGPDGSLYVVDFGEVSIAPEKGGIRVWENTGALWRIRRTSEPVGDRPPSATVVPSYATKAVVGAAAVVAGVLGVVALRRRRRRPRRDIGSSRATDRSPV